MLPPIDHPPGHEIERLNREIEEQYEDDDTFFDPLVGYTRRIGEFREEDDGQDEG
jgi:hypothetical protein